MTPDTAPVDRSRCPLCGKANECGAERGASTCWCYSVRIPDDVLSRVPEAQRDRACICEACASGRAAGDDKSTDISPKAQ